MTFRSLLRPTLLLVGLCLHPALAPMLAQGPPDYRDLSGTVTDASHEPLRGAVVQVHNDETFATLSFITGKDGHYSFQRLSGNANYHVWATFRDRTSVKHGLSPFNTDKTKTIDLEIKLN